jgi:Tol biopolymer transport system component
MIQTTSLLVFLTITLFSRSYSQQSNTLIANGEKHFQQLRQLTFGGENAEAYFSFDNTKIIFQSTRDSFRCDQIFTMNLDGTNLQLVSTGKGRTTCAYYFPNGKNILYASTHLHNNECPPPPDFSKGYVWKIVPDYDIHIADANGKNTHVLSASDGYDAEATISPKGDRIVFTSTRNGDLDLYAMNLDGTNITQLTNELGYDGGAFFSFDGKKICYRAFHPKEKDKIEEYQQLLKENSVRPSVMEIMMMDADGSNKQQLTFNGKANFAPFFHPDGKRIIFASNMNDTTKTKRNFDLFLMNIESKSIEQITFNESFDSFPMFTNDGKKLIFSSNRNAKVRGETNIFLADWND